ncbi:hypothetical protein C0J52_16275 [Blattella germanica]|nr:hypothetical protein C0J52_16275 [Blattella germanica]
MEMGRPCHTVKRQQMDILDHSVGPPHSRGPKADRDVDGQICSKNMRVVNGQDLQGIGNSGDVWNINCGASEQ